MNDPITLLFLNVGRRVELIRSFRNAFENLGLDGRIVCTDIDLMAPALYVGDARYKLPHSRDPGFLKSFQDLCIQEQVQLIIPLIDPDLQILASKREEIESTGARVLLSNQRAVEVCRDKNETFAFLKQNGIPTPETFSQEEANHCGFPLFIKPRDGSGSVNAFKITSESELEFFTHYVPNPVIQRFVDGYELTTDVFSDWSGVAVAAVPRRRLKVRSGEVSTGRIERNTELEQLCIDIAERLGTVGPINVQAIKSNDSIQIIEINPRFGGGCPLSIAAGVPLAQWTICMARQTPIAIESLVTDDRLVMMRYDDSIFRSAEELAW